MHGARFNLAFWSLAFMGGSSIAKLAMIGTFGFLAATLSVEAFALFGVLYSVVTLIGTMGPAGVGERAISLMQEYGAPDARARLFSSSLGLTLLHSVLVAVLISLAAPFFLARLGLDIVLVWLPALGVGGVMAGSITQGFLFRLDGQMSLSVLTTAGFTLAAAAGMAVGALLYPGLGAVFTGGLGATGLFALGLSVIAGIRARLGAESPIVRSFSNILPYNMIAVLGWVSGYGFVPLVYSALSATQVATYTFLVSVASIAQLAASSLNSVWTPQFVSYFNTLGSNTAAVKNRGFYGVAAITVTILSVLVLTVMAVAPLGIDAIAIYRSQVLGLSLMLAGYVVVLPHSAASLFYYVEGAGKRMMRVSIVSGSIGLLLWLGMVYLFGELGIYAGFLLNALVKSMLLWMDAGKRWRMVDLWRLCLPLAAMVIGAGTFLQGVIR